MKIAALTLLAGSAAAFAPQQSARVATSLNERSKALPFMNRPALVSAFSLQYFTVVGSGSSV
jgi:hypothetical protein